MNIRQLLFRNLTHYWRTNLAVIAGVVAATAVISGALVVGDSVRDSLKQMSLDRLGRIDHVVQGGRFFREELADELQQAADEARVVAPALLMQGTVEFERAPQNRTRAGQINVYGIDARAWGLLDHGDLLPPDPGQVVLNRRVADQLGIAPGDSLSLVVEIPASIPRDSLLGERNQTITELVLKVSGIAEDSQGLARLGMNPTQQLPANVFVSLEDLQSQVGLAAVQRTKRNPIAKPARVNALFISTADQTLPEATLLSRETAARLTETLARRLQLDDLGLRLTDHAEHGYLALESEQMFLEASVSAAALSAAQQLGAMASPVLVYLLNEIAKPSTPEKYSMYSVIAGILPDEPPPFGPFEFIGEREPLSGNRVYLNDWLAQDLEAARGDTIRVKYHVVGDRGELPEEDQDFQIAGIVKLTGPADDPGYTPTVPGVTDAESYDDWREPFPLKKDRITERDDTYWDRHRTTPKLFISLDQAQSLWKSRYGNLTTVRLAPRKGETLADLSGRFGTALLSRLDPRELGLMVQPVKLAGLTAAQGSTDFSGLFIGFSFFLILSATILVGLIFRLGVERRLSEIGLLNAVGMPSYRVRRLLLAEGSILVGLGGGLGSMAAVGYAALMIHGLKTWWFAAIGTRFLFLSVCPLSLVLGLAIAVAVALIAIWWALQQTKKQSVRGLLNGDNSEQTGLQRARLSRWLATLALSGSLVLLLLALAGIIPDTEAFAGFSWRVVLFFLVGIGLLMGTLSALAAGLASGDAFPIYGAGQRAELRLGFRNAARNRTRSVMTASLIASATFVIVAVAAGQINPAGELPEPRSGNGGFTLVAEANIPILYDLNTRSGRARLGFDVLNEDQMQLLDQARVFPFRMKPGENASCLNLYQTTIPTILGVPEDVLDTLLKEDRFLFADTPSRHPWALLREELPEGRIPVLGDMNTLMYSLHKPIGDTSIQVPGGSGTQYTLQIAGMLANSVLQGVLVMSETNFRRVFPEVAGFRYFLIDVDPTRADEVSRLLETVLGDYGFDADRVSHRLADFLAVQNTYLSTFQTLGGLGLLLGTLGLAMVMLRNVLERAGELALLRAVGFRRSQLAWQVIWENAFLLACGLISGTASALLAMSPHLMTAAANVPWMHLVTLLVVVFAVGMLAALVAVRTAVATPLLATLRGD